MRPLRSNTKNDARFTLSFAETFDRASNPPTYTLNFNEAFEHTEPPTYTLDFSEAFNA